MGWGGHIRGMSEHLMVFPDRETADQVAAELADEGFTEVRVVREALAGEDDSEDHEWAVYVREEMVADEPGDEDEQRTRDQTRQIGRDLLDQNLERTGSERQIERVEHADQRDEYDQPKGYGRNS